MPVKLQRVVSSDVQAYPDAYLKTRGEKKKKERKRGKERVKAGLRVSVVIFPVQTQAGGHPQH